MCNVILGMHAQLKLQSICWINLPKNKQISMKKQISRYLSYFSAINYNLFFPYSLLYPASDTFVVHF